MIPFLVEFLQQSVQNDQLARGLDEVLPFRDAFWLDVGEEVRVIANFPQLHEKV